MYKHTMAIYAIQCKQLNAVKIGITTSVYSRLRELQTAVPVKLQLLFTIPGSYMIERSIHRLLDHARLEGEWFQLSDKAVKEWLDTHWPTDDSKQPHLAERPPSQWAVMRENIQALQAKRRYDELIECGTPDKIPIAPDPPKPIRSADIPPSEKVKHTPATRRRGLKYWRE
jgi:Meiotically up-regulated gene 113